MKSRGSSRSSTRSTASRRPTPCSASRKPEQYAELLDAHRVPRAARAAAGVPAPSRVDRRRGRVGEGHEPHPVQGAPVARAVRRLRRPLPRPARRRSSATSARTSTRSSASCSGPAAERPSASGLLAGGLAVGGRSPVGTPVRLRRRSGRRRSRAPASRRVPRSRPTAPPRGTRRRVRPGASGAAPRQGAARSDAARSSPREQPRDVDAFVELIRPHLALVGDVEQHDRRVRRGGVPRASRAWPAPRTRRRRRDASRRRHAPSPCRVGRWRRSRRPGCVDAAHRAPGPSPCTTISRSTVRATGSRRRIVYRRLVVVAGIGVGTASMRS